MVASPTTRWLESSKRNPCPICGRVKDGDCRVDVDGVQVICHHPKDLRPSPEGIPGVDGQLWAFTGNTSDGRAGHFKLHEPLKADQKVSRKVIPLRQKPRPAPITGPITLATIEPVETKGSPWAYSSTQRIERINKADGSKLFVPKHRSGSSWIKGAGDQPWPVFGVVAPGWVLELEGEKCCEIALSAGVSAISQPGHAHKVEQIVERYRDLKADGVAGIVYVGDNDDEGERRAHQAVEAAAEVQLPLLVLRASEVWLDLPVGGSIDDARGTAAERVSAVTAAISAWLSFALPKWANQAESIPGTGIEAVLAAVGEGWHSSKQGGRQRSALAMGDLSKKLEKLGERLAFDQLALRPAVDRVVLPSLDVELLHAALSEQGWVIGKNSATDGLLLAARRHQFHPIRDYLDGVANNPEITPFDLDAVAPQFFRTTDPLHAAMVRKWLIGAVARAMQPGCKMDYCLVAQSDQQGIGKSTFFETLASPEWFCSTIPDDDKDLTLNIHNCWLFELAELEAVTGKRAAGRLKNLMTTARDLVRVPYGAVPERMPRPSAFCATVNRRDFLRDDTGNRRFWVVPINGKTKIDREAVAAARDGIWKAAVLAWRSKETPVLTDEQVERSEAQNLDFREIDPWFETVRAFSEVKANEGLVPIQLEDVLERLEIPVHNRNNAVSRRVRDLLEEAGWQYGRRRTDLGQQRGFWPPTN